MGKWSHRIAAALQETGYATTLWFADDFRLVQRIGRLSVLVFPILLALRILQSRARYDVVVVHEPSGFWYGALRRIFPSLPPMVVMCHNVESKVFRELLWAAEHSFATVPLATRFKSPALRLWQSDGAIRMADHVVCLSEVDRRYLIRHLGLVQDRITRMVNGVSAGEFHQQKRRRAGLRVLFIGGWFDVKGRRVLPPIWSHVRAQLPDVHLTIVGSGLSANSVLEEFDLLDRPSVTVIPRVTDPAQMETVLAAHDVFLMPSLSEGSPLSLLEAMAAGLPTVAARTGGIPDIIAHGENGFLFDVTEPSDAASHICHLLTNPSTAQRVAAAGQRRAAELTWIASAQTLGAVVDTLTRDQLCSSRHGDADDVRPTASPLMARRERA